MPIRKTKHGLLTQERLRNEKYETYRMSENRLHRVRRRSKSFPSGSASPLFFISNDVRNELRAMQPKCQRSLDSCHINKGHNPPLNTDTWHTIRHASLGIGIGDERPCLYGLRTGVNILVREIHDECSPSSTRCNDPPKRYDNFPDARVSMPRRGLCL